MRLKTRTVVLAVIGVGFMAMWEATPTTVWRLRRARRPW